MTIEHAIVQAGDGLYSVVKRILNNSSYWSSLSQSQKDEYAGKLAAANGFKGSGTSIYKGQILHYVKEEFVAPQPEPLDLWFSVVGKDILDPRKKKWVPKGANVGAAITTSKYGFTQSGSADGHAADAKALGWNCIRITVPQVGAGVTMQQTINGVDKVIAEYTALGIVCMVEFHGPTDLDWSNTAYNDCRSFWTGIAQKHSNNPNIFVNISNEPKGSQTGWRTWQIEALSFARNIFPKSILVADLSVSGQGAPTDAEANVDIADMKAIQTAVAGPIIFAWHCYGMTNVEWYNPASTGEPRPTGAYPTVGWFPRVTPTSFDSRAQLFIDANLPMVIGEVGCDWDVNRKTPATISIFGSAAWEIEHAGMIWATTQSNAEKFGVLAWHGTGSSPNDPLSLKVNGEPFYSTISDTEMGLRLKALAL